MAAKPALDFMNKLQDAAEKPRMSPEPSMAHFKLVISTCSTRLVSLASTVHDETEAPVPTPTVHTETAAPVPIPFVHNETEAPLPPSPVYNEGTVQRRFQPNLIQKEMLVSAQAKDAPKSIASTDCDDCLRSVETYQAY